MQTVLVLGSKPGALLPATEPIAVFAANGATMRAAQYREFCPAHVTSIVGRRAVRLDHNRKALFDVRPSRIIIRQGNDEAAAELQQRLPETAVQQMCEADQWRLQRQVFGYRLWLGEMNYAAGLAGQSRRFIHHMRQWQYPLGVSTGLFSVLLAAVEYPEANIVMAGIGVESGTHFYDHKGKRHDSRARVDAYLTPHLPDSLKRRLSTTDEHLAQHAGISVWDQGAVRPREDRDYDVAASSLSGRTLDASDRP